MTAHIVLQAGALQVGLDGSGRIAGLRHGRAGQECLAPGLPSHLLTFRVFGDARLHAPVSVRELAGGGGARRLEFASAAGVTLTVAVAERPTHARLALVDARDAAGACPVAVFHWGPIHTALLDPPGEVIGLVRAGGRSIGMLSLEPGTDGTMVRPPLKEVSMYWFPGYAMAGCTGDLAATWLQAEARDHTRDGVGQNFTAIRGEPGCTVAGSAIALYGCATADELAVIEQVELAEGLPHPMDGNTWMKRSPRTLRPDLWIHFNERNFAECLEIARRMGGASMSSFLDMLGNWGHFAPDPGAWPSGMEGIRAACRAAQAADVRVVLYTLTAFLKPITIPEPYIGPVPDDRLQTMGPATELAADATDAATTVRIANRPGLLEAMQAGFRLGSWLADHEKDRVVRIDNEILFYAAVRAEGDVLVLEGCERGLFHTAAAAHRRGARAVRLYLCWYRNFYPGTLAMLDEIADHIVRTALDGGFGRIQFDGHESCLETGHGIYARNRLTRRVYEKAGGRIPLYEGSNLGNYDWHVMSFIRWGEWDTEKGFRGTMIDGRLLNQVFHLRNRMPHGLGQYYPSDATVEDIEWLMARAAGWDAGVDFHVFPDVFARNPHREAMLDAIKLWHQAQVEAAFTEEQKRGLRQTDRLYTLAKDAGATWKLTFRRRWMHPAVRFLPAAAMRVAAGSPAATVAPCGIDWSWTHNPGIYAAAGLSDDLVWTSGGGEGAWTVTWPAADRETGDSFQLVLRLDKDAPAAVRDIVIHCGESIRIVIPDGLQPGQYLSIVHETPWVCIYDQRHEVVAETTMRASLGGYPTVPRGAPQRIRLSAAPAESGRPVNLRMNLRTHDRIKG